MVYWKLGQDLGDDFLKRIRFKRLIHHTMTIPIILNILVTGTLVRQIFIGNWHNVFLCALTLLLFTLPTIVERQLKIHIPKAMEIIILLFIFSSEILGEIHNFYGTFAHWDTMLHTLNGFLCAAIGFSLVDILNRHDSVKINLSPLFVALVAFSFSMTIGVLWEFFEYGVDTFMAMDMQKDRIVQSIATVTLEPHGKNIPVVIDNIQYTKIFAGTDMNNLNETVIAGGYLDVGLIDTMKDLLVNFVGAVVFSVFGWLYIKNRDKYAFAGKFMPMTERTYQKRLKLKK